MTKLLSYFQAVRGRASSLAKATHQSAAFLRQIANDERPCPPKLAVRIEQVTNQTLTRVDLCPGDWRELWPELASAATDATPATEQQGA